MASTAQAITETLRDLDVARTTFATSLQTHFRALSDFEFVCSLSFSSKEHDAARPNVRAALDEEIRFLAAHEPSISSTKTKLLRFKNMSTITSPIRTLPAEILARVFVFAVDSYITVDIGPHCRGPLFNQVNALSSVCSPWRAIALGTQQLWSYVDVERIYPIEYISLWLDRAGSHPLDVVNITPLDCLNVSEGYMPSLSLFLPRIQRVRSVVLRSDPQLMERWISGWCSDGAPRTLTTLALSSASETLVEFPAPATSHSRLDELFYSLDTLCLDSLAMYWNSLRCHNLVNLTLLNLTMDTGDLRNILTANLRLQYIHLTVYVMGESEPTTLPLIPLRWLHTLHLDNIKSCVFKMVAPGDCDLTLEFNWAPCWILEDSERNYAEFLRRSNVTTLYCHDRRMLCGAIAAESKLKVLYFEDIDLDYHTYDLLAPRASDHLGSFSGRSKSHLPYLHSIYLSKCALGDLQGLEHVVTACRIREVGIDDTCRTESGG